MKVSLIFNAISALVFVLGTWVMWSIAVQRGIPEQVTELLASLTIVFTPDGQLYFRVVLLLAIIGAIVMTGVFTLAAVLYNLISDIVGGVEVIVLEETYQVTSTGTQPTVQRVRPAVHRPGATPPPPSLTEEETEPHAMTTAVGEQ